ncbi:MAG: hypothetical protein DMF71_19415 [Acidobacteria bacterium]|nr:MAG: hypothetical protein DMF71_19415 [Acidobacteriota bacterium]
MSNLVSQSERKESPAGAGSPVYWRVEGSLLELSALRQVGFFTWHGQSFSERWKRRASMAAMALLRPVAYLAGRTIATRLLYALLRGVTRDRLDLLGEEYFHYVLKPKLRQSAVEKLRETLAAGAQVVLVGQSLDHVLRPLAVYLGAERFISNQLEFRDGVATGRLLKPIIRPRGPFAWIASGAADGRLSAPQLQKNLGWKQGRSAADATQTATRPDVSIGRNVVLFGGVPRVESLSVRESLSGKHLMLIGVTGFIGKVWLVELLQQIPNIRKITLLIRRNRTTTAQRRFEKIVEESPTFDPLEEIHGRGLGQFLKEKLEVVEGDVSAPKLGLDAATHDRLAKSLDVVVNSAGLTDFNPDLRDALASNVDSTLRLVEFLRASDHAALMHLSTCYIVGKRDGRVQEELRENYNPAGDPRFDSERAKRGRTRPGK